MFYINERVALFFKVLVWGPWFWEQEKRACCSFTLQYSYSFLLHVYLTLFHLFKDILLLWKNWCCCWCLIVYTIYILILKVTCLFKKPTKFFWKKCFKSSIMVIQSFNCKRFKFDQMRIIKHKKIFFLLEWKKIWICFFHRSYQKVFWPLDIFCKKKASG